VTAISTQYSIVLIGIEGISARAEATRSILRREAREMVNRSLASIRLRPADVIETECGDRLQLAMPPSVSPARLASTFVDAIDAELAARVPAQGSADAIRLMIALHCPPEGAPGEHAAGTPDLADALVTAQSLPAVLRAATRARLVLITSDQTYQLISRGGHRRIDTASFLPLQFDAAGLGEVTGWVTVPGYSAPPGLEPLNRQPGGADQVPKGIGHDPRDRRPVGRVDAEPGSRVGVLVQGGCIGTVVGGDQIINGDLVFWPRADETDSDAQ
jgi:hypothetical protein